MSCHIQMYKMLKWNNGCVRYISWWSNSFYLETFLMFRFWTFRFFQRMTNYCICKYSLLVFSDFFYKCKKCIGGSLTWLTSDRPFLRHMSAHTWAASTTQRRGCSASSVKFSCTWNTHEYTPVNHSARHSHITA